MHDDPCCTLILAKLITVRTSAPVLQRLDLSRRGLQVISALSAVSLRSCISQHEGSKSTGDPPILQGVLTGVRIPVLTFAV